MRLRPRPQHAAVEAELELEKYVEDVHQALHGRTTHNEDGGGGHAHTAQPESGEGN